MSIVRRAVGLEERSLASDLQGAFPGDVTGTTGWGPGMVWQGYSPGTFNTDRAMRLSAVFACLRLLSEAISTLPLDTYTRSNGTRRPFRPRPDYLSFQPPLGSRIEYLSEIMLSLLTDGNAYVLTPRDALGVPTSLVVLDPSRVVVSRIAGKVHYRVGTLELDPLYDLMHIKAMTMPGGVVGLSPIGYARETISLGLSVQQYGQAAFDNGGVPAAIIEMSDPADDAGQAKASRVAQSWRDTHGGSGNAQKVGVLLGGAKFNKISIQADQAQFLETRQFQVSDIARIYGVPPHLIADASNSTSWGSGLQEQNLAFGQFSLRPWIERIEDAHARLLTTHGLPNVFVKLNLDALLRASLKDRYEADAVGIENQFLTINEARSFEDLPPVPWGDKPYVPETVRVSLPPAEDPNAPPVPAPPAGGKP